MKGGVYSIAGKTLVVCDDEDLLKLAMIELEESGIGDLEFAGDLPDKVAPAVANVVHLSDTPLPFIEVRMPEGDEDFSLKKADHDGRRYWQVVSPSTRGRYYGLMKFLEGNDRLDQGPGFEIRGVVEGFYGPLWSWEDRSNIVRLMSDLRMNMYIYAPKDDPFHRERWRDLYGEEEIENFRALNETCKSRMIEFCYALSPGLSIDYSNDDELKKALGKLKQFYEIGVRCFGLFLDDIPEELQTEKDQEKYRSLGEAHRVFTRRLFEELRKLDTEIRLIFCPTEYWGVKSTSYHDEIAQLPDDILVFWTGPRICSKEIRSNDSAKIAKAFGRRLLVWDNYPVNDYDRKRLHINAVRNRDPDLPKTCVGMLTNPMSEAEASKVAIFTYGEYLWDPVNYDPEISLKRALTYVFGVDALPLAQTLADGLVDFFFDPDERTSWIRDAMSDGDDVDREILLHRFDEIAKVGDLICTLDNEQLVEEIEPYVRKVAEVGALGRLYIQRELINRKIGRNGSKVFSEKLIDLLKT